MNSDASVATIEVIPTKSSTDACLSQAIAGMGQTESFSEVAAAPDLDTPKSANGVAASMVTFVVTTGNGPVDFTGYIECQTLAKGKSFLRSEFASPNVRLDSAFGSWESLLAGIKIAKPASSGGTSKANATTQPKKTPTVKKTPAATATSQAGSTDFPSVSGTTYTSPAFGFTFTWPDGYEPYLASGDDTGDFVFVLNGISSALLFTKSTADGTMPATCLAEKEDALTTSTTSTNVAVVTDKSNAPLRGKTATGVYVVYSYTNQDGEDFYNYLSCDVDPTGAFLVDLSFIASASASSTFADELQAILNGIRFP